MSEPKYRIRKVLTGPEAGNCHYEVDQWMPPFRRDFLSFKTPGRWVCLGHRDSEKAAYSLVRAVAIYPYDEGRTRYFTENGNEIADGF